MKRKIIAISSILLLMVSLAFALTTGPKFPTAVTGNTGTIGGGGVAWGTPTNAEAADSVFTTCAIPDTQIGDDLIGTGFGFTITSTDTINGILLEVNVKQNTITGGGASDNSIKLLKAGAAVGTSLAAGSVPGTAAATASYGGSSNLWGTTWTPTDINNANFGAAISFANSTGGGTNRTVSVDFIRITVTSTPATSPTSSGFLKMFGFNSPPLKQQKQTRELTWVR
jgi:hypothetical protein